MIDLHTHILPGVDDGAGDLDEAVEMCRRSYEDGCRTLVATPHLRQESYWNDDRRLLEERFETLCTEVAQRLGDDLQLLLGGEIALHAASLDEIAELPGGELLPMAGTRYLLLEFDWRGLGPDPLELLHEVTVAGFRPIVAHPERYAWLMRDRPLVKAMVDQGALIQLTAMSVVGDLGAMPRDASEWLIDAGLAHILSSDTHDPSLRRPGLSDARDYVASRWGEPLARAMVEDHPRAVLEDRPIDPAAVPIERAGGRDGGLLSGLKRKLLPGDG